MRTRYALCKRATDSQRQRCAGKTIKKIPKGRHELDRPLRCCHGECGATHLYPTLLNPSPRLPLFLIHIYHHSPDGEPIRADSTVRSSPLPSFQLHHVHGVRGVELSFNGDVRERHAQRRPTRHALDSQHCNTANTAPAPPSRRRWTPALAASQAQAPRTSRETLT